MDLSLYRAAALAFLYAAKRALLKSDFQCLNYAAFCNKELCWSYHDIALGVCAEREVGDIHKEFFACTAQNGCLDCSPVRHNFVWIDRVADLPGAEHVRQQRFDLKQGQNISSLTTSPLDYTIAASV